MISCICLGVDVKIKYVYTHRIWTTVDITKIRVHVDNNCTSRVNPEVTVMKLIML